MLRALPVPSKNHLRTLSHTRTRLPPKATEWPSPSETSQESREFWTRSLQDGTISGKRVLDKSTFTWVQLTPQFNIVSLITT